MLQVKRADFVRRMRQIRTIQGVTWKRRRDKTNKATGDIIAAKGDIVSMQFIPKFDTVRGTKNWKPAGGHCFNAATKEIANEIKRKANLTVVLKMGEAGTNDVKAVCRCIPHADVETWTAEGATYRVVD